MKAILTAALIGGVFFMQRNLTAQEAEATATSQSAEATPLNQEMKTLDGKKVNLAKKYDDKVVLLVNVASKCG